MKSLKLRWLLIGNLISSTGTSFIWPLTTVYMHDYLGKSLALAGMVLFIESLIMIGGSYIGGYIYDQGHGRLWMLFSIMVSIVALLLLVFFNKWPAYPILLIVNGFAGAIANTIINALAASIKNHEASYVFNMMYFMANIGVVLGTLIVGFVVKLNIRYIFVVTLLLYIAFFVIALTKYVFENTRIEKGENPAKGKVSQKTATRSILIISGILLTYLMIQMGYAQWQSNLSVYMQSLGIGLNKYSYLWTVNGVIVVIGQPIISFLDKKYRINDFKKVYLGYVMFVAAFASLIFAKDYLHFMISMIIVTFGEVIAFPVIPAIVAKLSSNSERGKYQGFVSIAASIGHAVGPLLGGVIVEMFSYELLFETIVFLVLVFTIISLIITYFNLKK
ncbi:MDR family MFS transporter [Liquorilactobacillus mali]|uniref:MFS transporter n=1 Tax=Liquorilactobacillus mali KCTC 3596 = DSM 20444 TaxID=1046596 RepID=J0L5T9_9LACO|nr:MFS transporter [Liquorilactobacillus mali]EJE99726.1 MFS transporter [Liquorilactobacillus mali KCTC 3596 = DSM 20444]KRN09132.1 MFS transporter [Liquorilactobacillus mali KCTC 3596 = DSM 20444]MDC7953438.1 MFS transporter [Liquorilactobacillus mali]MDV7757812.1 MFS transporter [Liquorilactobacillus mali]QFQ73915.1 MFS transporter [Liquorilactobacillus mali]